MTGSAAWLLALEGLNRENRPVAKTPVEQTKTPVEETRWGKQMSPVEKTDE